MLEQMVIPVAMDLVLLGEVEEILVVMDPPAIQEMVEHWAHLVIVGVEVMQV